MSRAIVITGTDTGIGKTIFAAALAPALGATYWKPVQAGLDGETDSEIVARLAAVPIHPEAYRLEAPASPHYAAEQMGVTIDPARLTVPRIAGPLVIEAAGGLLVPLTPSLLFADLIAGWSVPVVLVARTSLGTINHSLLSIEALRTRGIEPLGIAFVGTANENSEATIAAFGKVKRLGRLPLLDPLDLQSLGRAFAEHFDVADFAA